MWWYHSHVNEPAETNAGLLGPIIITKKGMARNDGSPKDVDREFVTAFVIFNELDGEEPGLMHSINGYIFGNLRELVMKEGERVRWHLLGMGNEVDLHTPHWHGKTGRVGNGPSARRTDVVELLPGSMVTVDLRADNPGEWLFHCGDSAAAADLPAPWRETGPMKQLELVAAAALRAIEALRPRLHRSLVAGRLVEASGTTVLVTALAEDEDVMAIPWSAGEPWRAVTRRIARARRRWETPLALELWRAALRQWARPALPPPQAVVSVVGQLGIENPETAPMASGGASPLAIAVGRKTVSIAWDHRVYDAIDAAVFYERFLP